MTALPCGAAERLLAEALDGEEDAAARAGLDAHLASCAACRALDADLRAIRSAAAALRPLAVPPGVWPRVRRGLADAADDAPAAVTAGLQHAWTGPWLATAATLLLAVGAALGMLASDWRRAPAETEATPSVAQVTADLAAAESHYLKAIAGLEQIARTGDATLDPHVADVLRVSLRTIDSAIGDARAALRAQPDDVTAQRGLLDALEGKMALLENTVSLIGDAQAEADDQAPMAPLR